MSQFSVSGLISNVSSGANKEMENMANLTNSKKFDVTSPQDMAKMQMAMMKVNMSFQLEAAMIKNIEEMLKSIVQRM